MTHVIKDTKYDLWSQINWAKCNRVVNNLQRRIFVAKQEGRFRNVRKLQNLLLSSEANRCLAVRQVSLINSGRKTAGVDKKVFLSPADRIQLINDLRHIDYKTWKPQPTKRIYISKTNGQKRPLGIPTLTDRAIQVMVKNALEPEWEAIFEATSYGFRKNRSPRDAIRYIHNVCNSKSTKHWILNADIKGCFDNISHEYLLNKLKNFPAQPIIAKWLKAGYVEKHVFHDSDLGTPQGGVISPLLANIALHGMESALNISRNSAGRVISPYSCVRYADEFVVACRTREEATIAMQKLNHWLKKRGLQLSKEKTSIIHITDGFDFLGFNIRLYHSKKSNKQKLLIKPSKSSIIKIRKKLKDIWKKVRGTTVSNVISKMNPIIKGWSNYYSIGVSSEVFSSLDRYMWIRQYRHVNRTHPKKSWNWMKDKYWGKLCPNRNDKWVFGCKETGSYMYKFAWTPIKRHTMVKGTSSPFDPNLLDYWSRRNNINSSPALVSPSSQKIARKQTFLCPVCSCHLYNTNESVDLHHLVYKRHGGKSTYSNLMLLHTECHKKVHQLGWDKKILDNRLKVLINTSLRNSA